MTTVTDHDYAQLLQASRRYVYRHGHTGPAVEDLVQGMIVEALERPAQPFSLKIAYLHALDQLDPRHQQHGQKARDSAHTVSMEPQHTEQPRELRIPDGGSGALAAVPHTGSVRAVLLLYSIYGYTMAEIGTLFGVTESRISQVLSSDMLANPQPSVDPFVCQACHVRLRWKSGSQVRYCALCRAVRDRASRRRIKERTRQRHSLEGTP